MIKLISNQISPNLKIGDFFTGLFHLLSSEDLDFSDELGTLNYLHFNAARTGLSQLIKTLNIPKNKKIAIPAFTCAVTATPFLQAGYDIEWIDVNHNGLIDFNDFRYKSQKNNIGLVLCIHTFGQELNLKEFQSLCVTENIFLLEDCAHYLPKTEIIADARLYSFGREKIVSCISGGIISWNNTSKFFVENPRKSLIINQPPSLFLTIKLLLHPLIYSISLPWWNIGGKIIPAIVQKSKLLPSIITEKEKNGQEDFPQTTLSPALQHILKRQFQKYPEAEKHRQAVSRQWKYILIKQKIIEASIIIPQNAFRVIIQNHKLKSIKSLHLCEWDGAPIAPSTINLDAFQYKSGQCPNAEKFSSTYQTLPTNIRTTISDLKKLEKMLQFKEN